MRPALRWILTRALPVVVLAPLGLAAAIVWGAPYLVVGRAVRRMDLPPEVVATYKVGGSLLAYPLFLAVWTALLVWHLGWTVGLVGLVVLPALGFVAVRWMDALSEATQDLRLLARLAGPRPRSARARREARARIAAERSALTAEFDALRELMEAAQTPGLADPSEA